MANCQHLHPAGLGQEAVKRDEPGAPMGYDQLAHRAAHRAPDHGMVPKHRGRLDDRLARLPGHGGIMLREKIENTVEIRQRPARENYRDHRGYRD